MFLKLLVALGALLLLLFSPSAAVSPYSDPHFVGNRTVITHLMQWKFEDIAVECERFLGPFGYAAVQVSPVHESAVLDKRPWYELYQPVSYKIVSRSGNEAQFKDMVHRCNKAGVRVFVDIVLNHMTLEQQGSGSAGSHYNGATEDYPGVPFTAKDFHGHEVCHTADLAIHNYDDPTEARNCRLFGLRDLKQSSEYVRAKQADFLNRMIDIGVGGFRSDASQHQWPADLEAIYGKLHHLNTAFFPPNSRPFIYHEVIYNEHNHVKPTEYTDKLGRLIEFHYYAELANVVRGHNQLRWLRNFGQNWSMIPSDDAVVMIDNHDLQRGHNGKLGLNLNFFEPRLLKVATAFMLAWPYGIPRVMSSYYWNQKIQGGNDINDWVGPPTDASGNILSVKPNADFTCNKEWVCEHRWREIFHMVIFRNVAGNEPVANWWDNGDYEIAFSRGKKAFIAINLQPGTGFKRRLQTGLPKGTYCDVITGEVKDGKCTGVTVIVDQAGFADIVIDVHAMDPIQAIHVEMKLH